MSPLLRICATVVAGAVLWATVAYYNAGAIIVRMWPNRTLAITVGTTLLLGVAETFAWIGRRAFPRRRDRRALFAFMATYMICVSAALVAPRVMDLQVDAGLFWPRLVDMFSRLEYGLLSSVLFTFPVAGIVAASFAVLEGTPGQSGEVRRRTERDG